MKKRSVMLRVREKFSNQDVLKLGTAVMLGMVVVELLLGDVPQSTLMSFALVFYYWRHDVAYSQGDATGKAIGEQASTFTLRVVIVALMIGFFISFRVETIDYSLRALMHYGLALVFGLKGFGLWFFQDLEPSIERHV
ncbi:hypothetical protein [Exiguobacterium sp. SH0S7]|uniref:hypothetical protein n=1 Tax=Exiguobacterium sp. SH0S7 TaxID=2510951 RepID=UPI0013157A88|nr:hypothetical protein [Exiguobacterium sp. SH0S7]